MCHLLETIRYENGRFENLNFHRQRMKYAREILFGIRDEVNLENRLQQAAEKQLKEKSDGLYKCRVVYGREMLEISFLPYILPKIGSLQLVFDNGIDYAFKYENRDRLNQLFARRGGADDVLIVKNGLITDTSFCNILFFNGKQWLTPEQPLLRGTRRAALQYSEQIRTAVIGVGDLHHFTTARLVNAMIRFEDRLDIPIENIRS